MRLLVGLLGLTFIYATFVATAPVQTGTCPVYDEHCKFICTNQGTIDSCKDADPKCCTIDSDCGYPQLCCQPRCGCSTVCTDPVYNNSTANTPKK